MSFWMFTKSSWSSFQKLLGGGHILGARDKEGNFLSIKIQLKRDPPEKTGVLTVTENFRMSFNPKDFSGYRF
jgi:hypothetical protein